MVKQSTKAMSVFEHYTWRLGYFMLDVLMLSIFAFLLLLLTLALHCFVFHSSDLSFLSLEIGVPVVLAAFCLHYLRARQMFINIDLSVVDGDGRSVSGVRAAVRSLAYLSTWFLLPVHLILIASGSRRLLHDRIAGTYVIGAGEDLRTSFYPPAKPWLAIGLVVGSVVIACSFGQLAQQFDKIDSFVTPLLLGSESRSYLNYLKMRCLRPLDELDVIDRKSARLLAPHYLVMRQLQHKYYGYDSNYSVRILYSAAMVAARAQRREDSDALVKEMSAVPNPRLVDAGVKDRKFLGYLSENPQTAAAYFYSKNALVAEFMGE